MRENDSIIEEYCLKEEEKTERSVLQKRRNSHETKLVLNRNIKEKEYSSFRWKGV